MLFHDCILHRLNKLISIKRNAIYNICKTGLTIYRISIISKSDNAALTNNLALLNFFSRFKVLFTCLFLNNISINIRHSKEVKFCLNCVEIFLTNIASKNRILVTSYNIVNIFLFGMRNNNKGHSDLLQLP